MAAGFPEATASPKLTVSAMKKPTSRGLLPSGSTKRYGLLLAYAYRLKLWGF